MQMEDNSLNAQDLNIEASLDNLPKVLQFVESYLETAGCPLKAQMHISLAVEEIFVNISSYAYAPGTGDAVVSLETEEEPAAVILTFKDCGVPYNPLEKADPDISLPAGERQIGGLGIFLTKKTMDDVVYEYKDGQNILHLKKLFHP